MTRKCSYCHEADAVLHADFPYACDACFDKGICFFCMKEKAVGRPPDPIILCQAPVCAECEKRRQRGGMIKSGLNAGCLFIVGLIIVGIVMAIRSC